MSIKRWLSITYLSILFVLCLGGKARCDKQEEKNLSSLSVRGSSLPEMKECLQHPFNQRPLYKDPKARVYWTQRFKEEKQTRAWGYRVLYATKKNKQLGMAGGNALTFLHLSGEDFSYKDFSHVSAIHSMLRHAKLGHVDFSYADLSHSCLEEACLEEADFSFAQLKKVDWGIDGGIPLPSMSYDVVFSPDGRLVATVCLSHIIRIFDVTTRKRVGKPIQGSSQRLTQMCFSPQSKYLMTINNGSSVTLWDPLTGAQLGELSSYPQRTYPLSIACSPDGKTLLVGSHNGILLFWDLATQELTHTISMPQLGAIWSVAYSPRGDYFATGSSDGMLRLWEANQFKTIGTLLQGHDSFINTLVFSIDGKYLFSGSDDCIIKVWDLTQEVPSTLHLFYGHLGPVVSLTYHDQKGVLVSTSEDRTVRFWDLKKGKEVHRWVHQNEGGFPIRLHPKGEILSSGSYAPFLSFWSFPKHLGIGQWREKPLLPARSLAVSLDGKYSMVGYNDHMIRLWDNTTGKMIGKPWKGHREAVTHLHCLPDGQRVLSFSEDGTLRLWDIKKGKQIGPPLWRMDTYTSLLCFSKSGRYVAYTGMDSLIYYLDLKEKQLHAHAFSHRYGLLRAMAFSSNEKKLVFASSRSLHVIDRQKKALSDKPFRDVEQAFSSIAFSPDGTKIVGGTHEGKLLLWDTSTDEMIVFSGQPHTGWINQVIFSPDGQYVVSCSTDKMIRLWSVEEAKSLDYCLDGMQHDVSEVCFTPDGRSLLAISYDGSLRRWRFIFEKIQQAFSSLDVKDPYPWQRDFTHLVTSYSGIPYQQPPPLKALIGGQKLNVWRTSFYETKGISREQQVWLKRKTGELS